MWLCAYTVPWICHKKYEVNRSFMIEMLFKWFKKTTKKETLLSTQYFTLNPAWHESVLTCSFKYEHAKLSKLDLHPQQTTPPTLFWEMGPRRWDWYQQGRKEVEKDTNGCSKLHFISCICNVGMPVSVQPCAWALVHSVRYPAFLHATAPQVMAICHWLGLLINTARASHDSSRCTHTHTHTHSQ